jgi:UDP-N-acetylglucosamine--N-acetylmuramyl-(pentapeptide) pyrophosphoryl-undecaprenol N-acetylglucosamine transferase
MKARLSEQAAQRPHPDQPPASKNLEALWVGAEGEMEEDLVKRAGVPFEAIPAAGVHGVSLRALPGNVWKLSQGYRQAGHLLRRFRPDVLFFTGGYVAVPVALAGRSIPSLLYVPDLEPGLALKTLARFADHIALTAGESREFFPATDRQRTTVTGYPVRRDLTDWNLEDAHRALDLAPGLPTLLVFGGSKGARSINQALMDALPQLLEQMQVVHVSGQLDWPQVQVFRERLDERRAARYRAFAYLHERMGAALRAADLALSRAGAATLGEFPAFGLPAVLVPYPHAWRYQKVNALHLVEQGAAVMIRDEALEEHLLAVVQDLMGDSSKLERMRRAMHSLAHPDAAKSIAGLLFDLAAETSPIRM